MHPVVKRLSIFAPLSAEEVSAISLAMANVFSVPAGHVLAREDDPPINLLYLLEGMAYRHKTLFEGGRQILSLLLPGDPCDVGITLLARRDHSLTAAVPSRLARISDAALEQLCSNYPRIRAAIQWATLSEESISREWLVNVGQRSALSAMAHLMCELYYRLRAIDLVDGLNFAMPLTQSDLGDAVGITPVHSNRVVQELRRRKLIAMGDGRLTILSLQGMEELAVFDPGYLHLEARYSPARRANS